MGFKTDYHDPARGLDIPGAWCETEATVGQEHAIIGWRIYPSKQFRDQNPFATPIATGNMQVQDTPGYEQTFTDVEGLARTEPVPETRDFSDHFHTEVLSSSGNHPIKAAENYLRDHAPWQPQKES